MSTERITDSEVWIRSVEKRLRVLENRDIRGAGPSPLYVPTQQGYASGGMNTTYSGGGGAGEVLFNLSMNNFDAVSLSNGTRLLPEKRGFWVFFASISLNNNGVVATSRAFVSVNFNNTQTSQTFRFTLGNPGEQYMGVCAMNQVIDLDPVNEYIEVKAYQNFTTNSVTWAGKWQLRWVAGG